MQYTNDTMTAPEKSSLGKKVQYDNPYDPSLLFPIPRETKRTEIGITQQLPFIGVDVWNAFELCWLNPKGKPIVALGEFVFSCESPRLVESKSLKLYLNSFNKTKFSSKEEVVNIMTKDLSEAVGSPVTVHVFSVDECATLAFEQWQGVCLDDLDVECTVYQVEPNYLITSGTAVVTETIHSHLLKSNCLVTGQPDWASIQIHYRGKQIDHAGLLKYIVSFRDHNGFSEHCVEHIFMDIWQRCQPEELSIEGRYTRRGGLDINPIRSTGSYFSRNLRLDRQ